MGFNAAHSRHVSAIIERDGVALTIGTTPARGLFSAAGKLVQLYDGSISTTGPVLLVSETVAATVTENSTIITIDSITYQATQKLPDGAGFVELELTKDY